MPPSVRHFCARSCHKTYYKALVMSSSAVGSAASGTASPLSDTVNRYGWKALAGSAVGYAIDGFLLLKLGFMLSAIGEQQGLPTGQAGSLATWALIGAGWRGIVYDMLSDRYGRIRVLTRSIVLFA